MSVHFRLIAALTVFLASMNLFAQLQVEVKDGSVADYNMAVSPLAVLDGANAELAADIVSSVEKVFDITGFFNVLNQKSFLEKPEVPMDKVDFKLWRNVAANGLVKGTIKGKDEIVLDLAFYDVNGGNKVFGKTYKSTKAGDAKKSAYRFAAEVIKILTKEEMNFMFSKIAFVEKKGESYSLVVTNFDGSGRKVLVGPSSATILLPEWSADGSKIYYTSHKNNNPNLFVVDLATTRIKTVSSYEGLNVSATAHPDNKTVSLCLSKDGNSEIYSLDTATNELKRLTKDVGTDTAPSVSPDGSEIVFVSNRSGNPQIYRMSLTDLSKVERLTEQGNYNQDPEYSPDGKKVAFSGRDEKYQFDIFVIDLASKQISRITQNQGKNESPTFSPDSKLIGFSSNRNGKNKLFLSNVSGTKQIAVYSGEGEVLMPSWSPAENN
jgi:Periplasmic component of the Tol biopolymer transport system